MQQHKSHVSVPGVNESEQQKCLAEMYANKQRPVCACKNPPLKMYIAKVGQKFVVKRMPNTGCLHHPNCEAYEPPPELSGLGDVMGTAIKENTEAGFTELKFEFSLSKTGARGTQTKTSQSQSDSVKTDGHKLTLRSTLHYLWEEAQFNKWYPAMSGKRSWYVIRKHLLQTALSKMVKGHSLAERLYIPEPFSVEKKDSIKQAQLGMVAKMTAGATGSSKPLMILIGELKEIIPARYGHRLVIKHAPDFPFMLNDDIYKRLHSRFDLELELSELEDTHLIVIATASLSVSGIASVEEIALMTVTSNWIPFETIHEKAVINALTDNHRTFVKGLRYNLPQTKPLACTVLTDTPNPTAMYIMPIAPEEEFRKAMDALIEDSKMDSWIWDTTEFEIPELPAATK